MDIPLRQSSPPPGRKANAGTDGTPGIRGESNVNPPRTLEGLKRWGR